MGWAAELVIADGGKGLEAALASLWDDGRFSAAPCTRSAICWPRAKHLHDEIKADFNHMMNAKAAAEVESSVRRPEQVEDSLRGRTRGGDIHELT